MEKTFTHIFATLAICLALAACGSADGASIGTVVTPLYPKDQSLTAAAGKSPVAGISGHLDNSWMQPTTNASVVAENHLSGPYNVSSQATATLLTAMSNIVVGITAPTGDDGPVIGSGVLLSGTVPIGGRVRVTSLLSTDNLTVYPPVGGTVDGNSVNVGVVLSSGAWAEFEHSSADHWTSTVAMNYYGPGMGVSSVFKVNNLWGHQANIYQTDDALGFGGIAATAHGNSSAQISIGMGSSSLGNLQVYAPSGTGGHGSLALNPLGGNVLVGTGTDNLAGAKFQVAGAVSATQYNVSSLATAPTSASAAGTTGEVRITAGFIYVCVAPNTWGRVALASW